MKRFLRALLALVVLISPNTQAQNIIFQEDFDGIDGPTAGGAGTYVFPSGWLLRNVDNGTPNASVAYVNEAWERREDFKFNVADSAAFSTSWYAPVGAADDWMWTPPVTLPTNCRLKWNAVAYDPTYPDGYEVRIMVSPNTPTGGAGVLGNQVSASTQLFSIGAENSAWTARTVDLSTYAGQTVRIAYRNTSNDKFILVIDDVVIEQVLNNEVSIESVQKYEYTLTPLSQVPAAGLPLSATIKNNGINAANNLALTARVYDSNSNLVYTASSTPATLASGATTTLTTAGFVPSFADNFTVEYEATMSVADDIPANNTATAAIDITKNVYARDNSNAVGSLGIGAGNGGYLGQDFIMENSTSIGAVQVYYTQGYTGERIAAAVWDMVGGVPNAIVAYTDTLTYIDNDPRLYTLPIHGGNFALAPGRYAVTAIEFDSTIAVGLTTDIYTAGRTWVNWPTSPLGTWGNNEDFGASYQRAYIIRPVICPGFAANESSTAAVCTTNGTALVSPANGESPYTYSWSNGATTASITASAGTYNVTITDNFYCQQSTSVTVGNNSVTLASSTGVNDANCTAVDGGASVSVSNGTSPYVYAWSNGGNTSAISNLSPATYTVTVTDANGCTGTNTAIVGTNTVVLSTTPTTTPATCSAADGSASISVANGFAPYNYAWSNGGNASSIANVVAANYTVTVTDTKGCSAISTLTVAIGGSPVATTTSSANATCTSATGSASVVATSGVAPYTYTWSNSATTSTISGLTAGTYNVTVLDANGCAGNATVLVETTTVTLTLTTSSTETGCVSGTGSASVDNVTNGTSPYSYVWSNTTTAATATSLSAGSYQVTVTDNNGCTATAEAVVNSAASPSLNVIADNIDCNANTTGSANVSVTGGLTPITYLWSNGNTTQTAANLAPGNYSVTVTDANGCTATASATVTEPAAISISGIITDVSSGNNGAVNVSVTGGVTPYAYNWSNSSTTEDVSGLSAGTYTVTVTDDNGCTSTATYTLVSVGIADVNALYSVKVYPNPASNTTQLQVNLTKADELKVEMVDVTGKLVYVQYAGVVKDKTFTLNLTEYAAGVYFIHVSGNNVNTVQRLTIEK
ncbi:MAG: hypothetical protein RLZZ367_1100 [Bacteroidota bacterium]|jgi:hypothetical protein